MSEDTIKWFKSMWQDFACLFGFHETAVYRGRIKITDVNRATHKIEYGNIKECPNCGKTISVDFW